MSSDSIDESERGRRLTTVSFDETHLTSQASNDVCLDSPPMHESVKDVLLSARKTVHEAGNMVPRSSSTDSHHLFLTQSSDDELQSPLHVSQATSFDDHDMRGSGSERRRSFAGMPSAGSGGGEHGHGVHLQPLHHVHAHMADVAVAVGSLDIRLGRWAHESLAAVPHQHQQHKSPRRKSFDSAIASPPRTYAHLTANYYHNVNTEHEKSFRQQLQQIHKPTGGRTASTHAMAVPAEDTMAVEDEMDDESDPPVQKRFDTSALKAMHNEHVRDSHALAVGAQEKKDKFVLAELLGNQHVTAAHH